LEIRRGFKARSLWHYISLSREPILYPNHSPDEQQFLKAIADFTEAIQLNPDSAESFYNRGEDYNQVQQLDNAMVLHPDALTEVLISYAA